MEDKQIARNASPRMIRAGLAVFIAAFVVAGVTWHGASVGASAPSAVRSPGPSPTPAADQSPAPARIVGDGRVSYADIVKAVAPSVITIRTEGRVRMAPTSSPDDDMLRRFFGDQFGGGQRAPRATPRQGAPRQSGLGSGVVVSADGYILTNNHVVANADKIHVDLNDGRTVEARLVGADEPSDLAIVKIEASGLHALALGNSDVVQVGDVVLAIGNPLGLGQTVTMGIVSAKGRSTDPDSYEEFLQTDAPINHGNSGGALVNMKGELVGINSQIASVSDGNIGIGFAIPANMAKHVMDDLKSGGRVRRSQMGVSIQGVTSDIARSLGLKDVGGAIVSGVTPGSAADRAGVKQNDVITSFNGQPVKDTNGLRNRVAESQPGSTATLVVIRDGSERTLSVKLDEKVPERASADVPADRGDAAALGVTVTPLTPELARRSDIPRGVTGVLVEDVDPDSRAADAGIRPGDVIQQANKRDVRSADDLRTAIRAGADRPALLLVNRGGQTIFVTV